MGRKEKEINYQPNDILQQPQEQNEIQKATKNNLDIRLIVIGIVFLLLFCTVLLAGITYTSMVFSKAITESAISGAASAIRMINDERPKPVENLDFADVSLVDGDGAYMGAIRNRVSEFKAITKASSEETAAFDSMIRYATETSKNKLLQTVFSPDDDASAAYAGNGYNVWTYITTIKKTSGIDFDAGTALLEAAALVKYSAENNIPLSLAVGVAQTESSFNPGAYSNKEACGPMQVVYDIHKELLDSINIKTKEELFSPDRGVQAGCYLLGRYLKAEGSVTGGLKRYYGTLSPSYINQVLNNRHAFELFAEGIEKNVAAAIEKEQVNWERMSTPKTPVYTEADVPAPSKTSSAPSFLASGQPVSGTTTIRVTGEDRGLTIKPDEEETKGSLSYYNKTGTIIVTRPQRTKEIPEKQPEETHLSTEPLTAKTLRETEKAEENKTEKVTIQDLLNAVKTPDFVRE